MSRSEGDSPSGSRNIRSNLCRYWLKAPGSAENIRFTATPRTRSSKSFIDVPPSPGLGLSAASFTQFPLWCLARYIPESATLENLPLGWAVVREGGDPKTGSHPVGAQEVVRFQGGTQPLRQNFCLFRGCLRHEYGELIPPIPRHHIGLP